MKIHAINRNIELFAKLGYTYILSPWEAILGGNAAYDGFSSRPQRSDNLFSEDGLGRQGSLGDNVSIPFRFIETAITIFLSIIVTQTLSQ